MTAFTPVSEPLWAALRAAEGPLAPQDLARASGAHVNAIYLRLDRWVRAGMIGTAEPAAELFTVLAEPPAVTAESRVWRAFAGIGASATPRAVADAAGCARGVATKLLNRWVDRGYVARVPARPRTYFMIDDSPRPPRMTADATVLPARQPTARQRVWAAIRVLKSFDVPTLVITSGATRRSAEDFVNALTRAGYLTRATDGRGRNEFALYRLVRRVGPLAPKIEHNGRAHGRLVRTLVDRNDGSRHDISPAAVSLRSCVRRGHGR